MSKMFVYSSVLKAPTCLCFSHFIVANAKLAESLAAVV